MEAEKIIQGRCVTPSDVALIRGLLADRPPWNRTRLSRELCQRWDWRNEKGRLKDMACRRIPGLWMESFGHPFHLLETFVERQRFRGTCYRAAGWTHVGATAGRSRNDVHATRSVPVKEVFVYPLHADFRGRLCT